MVLNYIWLFFFFAAFATGLVQTVVLGRTDIFPEMLKATFDSSKLAFDISIGLTGALTLWMGLMKVGEEGGAVKILSRIVRPFFSKLFPEIPKDHPVYGTMMMNFSANMLGLDNAATPVGLKTMQQLQELNPEKEKASNAQIMFLVLNTSGLTLIPISVMVYRAQLGAANPADVFLPILLTTFFSTLSGLVAVALVQKIRLRQKAILIPLAGITLVIFTLLHVVSKMPQEDVAQWSSFTASFLLLSIILSFLGLGVYRRINVYESFISGAKEGFSIAVRIIPYLVAILVAIAVFRTSGAMELIMDGIRAAVYATGLDQYINIGFVDALPTAMMKPLSGSGARGMMVETMDNFGADSFAGRLASTFQGATDTTFYVIAVYFGSVGIRNTRHAVTCGLIADAAGILAAMVIATIFFG